MKIVSRSSYLSQGSCHSSARDFPPLCGGDAGRLCSGPPRDVLGPGFDLDCALLSPLERSDESYGFKTV